MHPKVPHSILSFTERRECRQWFRPSQSSCHGSSPVTTIFGRNLSILIENLPRAFKRLFKSFSDASFTRRYGASSARDRDSRGVQYLPFSSVTCNVRSPRKPRAVGTAQFKAIPSQLLMGIEDASVTVAARAGATQQEDGPRALPMLRRREGHLYISRCSPHGPPAA
eukprot:scaffold17328_cov74-Cyclotella_meneghiniana.AAC.1